MHRFTVWAPDAARVDLVLTAAGPGSGSDDTPERRLPMTATGDGWFAIDVPEAGHGTDYAFSLDGGRPLPDPRSAWQPAGVHGPSRVFDPSRYAWT